MKPLVSILTIVILLAACSAPGEEGPQDLDGKKALLTQKRAEFQNLSNEITQLEKEINQLSPAEEKNRSLVTTTMIKPTEFKKFVEIQGTVQSDNIVMASAEIGGIILELPVQEGQNVNKGQLIARLDLGQIDKQMAEIQTSLDLAVETYERQKRLWDQNIGSEIQYLQAKNNKERLEKSLETLAFQKGKAVVYSPISGVVEQVILKAGELAGPGMPIAQILNTQQVKVVADVPENYLQSVKKGDKVTVAFPALGTEQIARVNLVGRTIDPQNRTFNVEVELDNRKGILKPNLLATMLINDHTEKDVIVIPLELVQQEVGGKRYVFIKAEGKDGAYAKKIYISIGESFDNQIVINSGLKGGEELIVEGARSISANELISVKQEG